MRENFLQPGQVIKQVVTLVLFCCLVLSSGCATVMTGKYQSIAVTSEPPGAKVRADTGEIIMTPSKFHLIRNEDHTLMAEYPGREPQQIRLHNKAQGWVWGNILLGGVIGLIVDCVSGASDELIPKEVHFNFANPEFTTKEAVNGKEKDKKAVDKVATNKKIQIQENVPEVAQTNEPSNSETK